MALTAILEFRIKPDVLDEAREALHAILADTRAFAGCQGVDVLVDETDPGRWLLYETWESAQADAAYREFRAGPGDTSATMGPLLAAAPLLTKYTVDPRI